MAEDARLVGRLLHWRDPSDRICFEAVYGMTKRRRLGEDRIQSQLIVPKPASLSGAWTSITSNWNDGGNYYHWILDGLSRLSLRDSLPERTGVLIPGDLPRFATETLDLLGLRNECRVVDTECIQPERYYFCAPTAMTGVRNGTGYDWLRRNFSPHFGSPGSGSPVFLTRRGNARIPGNLDLIEKVFASNGYQIVDCGGLTVKEQILIISTAPALAGLHGAAMTNLLWAACGTPVLEIFQQGYLNGCYEQIALHGNLDYSFCVLEGENPLREINDWLGQLNR